MSNTGLTNISVSELAVQNTILAGDDLDSGTLGQVLISGGDTGNVRWGSNSATLPNALTMGSNVFLTSGNSSFNGGIADTINAVDNNTQLNLTSGDGITITNTGGLNRTIETDNDEITISNSTGENKVLKVPGTLTINQNTTLVDTFDGSTNKTINLEGKYTAGDGIDISGHPVPHIEADTDEITISHNVGGAEKLQVLKVPNTLTITDSAGSSVVFDGSSTQSITINDNDTTYTGGDGIVIGGTTIETVNDGTTISNSTGVNKVLKVPNTLTFTGYATGSFDGSSNLSINLVDTDTTYQGGTGISINTATNPDTINCSNIPNSALANSTISGISLGSNLANLTFYSSSGAFITSYNGANPPTSITLDGDTTYQGGSNITIDTSTNPDTIDLDASLTNIEDITFVSAPVSTTLKGNDYPSNPTTCTYLDLSDTTNVIPGAVLATKVQRTQLIRSFTNVYSEYSSNFRTSFKAQSSNVMVEFRALVRADNKVFYGGLYNYATGSYNTDTRNRFNYNDETDQDHTVLTWWMRNLTPGSTYYISPYFRGSSSTVYIYAGHSGITDGFAPAIMRIIDGGNNVNIY
jgi:hypothetical protein